MTSVTSHTRGLIQILSGYGTLISMIVALSLGIATDLNASLDEDAKTVTGFHTNQAAVKSNDGITMDQVLADDFVLVTGRGKVFSRADLIDHLERSNSPTNIRMRRLEHSKSECGVTLQL